MEWLQSSSSFVNFDVHASKEPLDWLNQTLTKILSNYDDEKEEEAVAEQQNSSSSKFPSRAAKTS